MIECPLLMDNEEQSEWVRNMSFEIDSYMYDYSDPDIGFFDYAVDNYLNSVDGKEKIK